jgi:hypothetical protein
MYRPQWVEKALDGRSILDCALDVHMTNTGSYDRDAESQKLDKKVLNHVLENWKNPTGDFDQCVKNLIIVVLKEKQWSDNEK